MLVRLMSSGEAGTDEDVYQEYKITFIHRAVLLLVVLRTALPDTGGIGIISVDHIRVGPSQRTEMHT